MIIKGIKNAKITQNIFNLKLPFQLLNADCIASKKHILHAINQATSKTPITNNIWMEILVRASAQRQISNAIKTIGAKGENANICVVCDSEETFNIILEAVGGIPDEDILELRDSKINNIKKIYNIKENENDKEYIIKRVCERISIIEVI